MTDRRLRGRFAVAILSFAVASAVNLGQAPALQAQSLTPEQVQSLAQAREETRIGIFRQAIAEAASQDSAIAAFYQTNGYTPIWTGDTEADTARRRALMLAIAEAPAHGLPAARYDGPGLMEAMRKARTPRELGLLEVELSRSLLRIARDLHSGILVPSEIDRGIVRKVTYQDRFSVLNAFSTSNPATFFRALAPATAEYNRLMKEKMRLEGLMAVGGWGPTVSAKALKPGESGPDVIALRNRLVAMGYLDRSASVTYDGTIQAAVQSFQVDHGLIADGVAGASTLSELNIPVEDRLKSVIVAMERERWLGAERGKRHILVNLTDFQSKIIDDDKITFQTRSVIGAVDPAKRTPEFSDMMTYLEINPDWTVPTGIIQRDYLPALQRNPNALSHLQVTDARGRVIPRGNIDFSRYTARTFPYNLRQPPSRSNALGTVKFMFPNPYAIYLHDTPDKSLFSRESRAYSNGCVRLNDPHDFAYALLARQEADPKTFFDRILDSGTQTRVNLVEPVPVHLIYRTAFTNPKGRTNFRRDVYGRDTKIWEALERAGVELRAVQG
ncbi:MAG: L,D-transpeptidase family protein [Rhodobacterales bacterium]|nr:L,D-transpeptidase family protein [Rhodobacterales bacterium]MDX5389577.1 L,D-transpeptidase family protein [Rhodobacterales bacterium]MDX5489274.1 L,D-transpeptidase family protein [Rhodobacterales bacterium]